MKGCWDMISKKLVSKVVLGLMLATPFSLCNIVEANALEYTSDTAISDDVIASEVFPGGSYLHAILAHGENTKVDLSGETISATMEVNQDFSKPYTFSGITAGSMKGENGAVLQLGGANTQNININTYVNGKNSTNGEGLGAVGLWALNNYTSTQKNNGGLINVNGKNLNISVYSGQSSAYGILAQNSTTVTTADTPSTININTENTKIVATSGIEGGASGIVALSQGIVNINSNLEVDSDNAIVARGDAIVRINKSGEKTTKLNGDINFNYDGPTSGTKVNADVIVNLSGENSYWNGNSKISWNYDKSDGSMPSGDKLEVKNLRLNISDGAQWNPVKVENFNTEGTEYITGEKYIALNNLNLNDGVINLEKMGNQELEIENIKGEGGTVNVASSDNKLVITKENDINSLTVAANQVYSEQLVQNDMGVSLQNLIDQVVDSTDPDNVKSAATSAYLSETAVTGVTTAQVDEKGKVILNTINERVNPSNNAISNMASIALMAWRAENNDMNKRLGELRDSKGEHGIWARMVRGEGTYKSIKNQYNTYQLGYDEKLSTNPKWTVGAALSYTEGESGFNGGSGENKHTGFSVYGSYLNDDGSFIDLIAKYARLDHDFDVIGGAGSGDYETNGYSVSAEYGKRFKQDNGMWIEPQVELTYGKIGSANYKTDNGVSVRQDGMDSLVGRIGFALGKDFKQGNAYVRASYLYDFEGETDIRFTKNGVTRGFEQDLGGGWFEVGLGTNINLSDATHLYMDIEKTYGGDVATPWQWNVGVRYSF